MNCWQEVFEAIQKKPYFIALKNKVNQEYLNFTCYPERDLIFNAFKLTPLEQVKVVIIGQDPYHQPHQAMGLAFSVPKGLKLPPSLRNIYREIEIDLDVKMQNSGDLTYLAKQGVLLLNTRLSVRQGEPMSHNFKEYELLLNDILNVLNNQDRPVVYILWGNSAKSLKKHLNNPKHLYLTGTHPSPLSANRGGFFNRHYFSATNHFLIENQVASIKWHN